MKHDVNMKIKTTFGLMGFELLRFSDELGGLGNTEFWYGTLRSSQLNIKYFEVWFSKVFVGFQNELLTFQVKFSL